MTLRLIITQRHRGVNQRQNRQLIHIASVKNNSVALSGQANILRLFARSGKVVTIGDDQPFVMRLRPARRPAQQTAEIEAVKRRDDQTDAVAGAIRQRACASRLQLCSRARIAVNTFWRVLSLPALGPIQHS